MTNVTSRLSAQAAVHAPATGVENGAVSPSSTKGRAFTLKECSPCKGLKSCVNKSLLEILGIF